MSMTGCIHLYVEQFPIDLEATFYRVAEWAGSENIRLICRGTAVLDGDPLAGDAALGFSSHELIANQASVDAFWAYYQNDSVISGTFVNSPRACELADGFAEGIDPSIRGTFMPQELAITIGQFRLIDLFKNDGEVVGLPCVEVHFFGYGIPNDWAATRARIRQLPEILNIQRDLASLFLQDVKVEALWVC